MPYKTILVHLNDKRRAEALLDPAVCLASRHNAHLIGMHAYSRMPAPPIPIPYGAKCWARWSPPSARRRKNRRRFARMTANQPFVAEWRP